MQLLTTVITLFIVCGAAVGGPVGDLGSLQKRGVPMFKYCDDADLDGACSLDDENNVDVCERVGTANSAASTLIYRHFECALYLDAGCAKEKLVQKSGQHELPDNFRNKFRSYQCHRV